MNTENLPQELIDMRAKAEAQRNERDFYKKEREIKIIDANNKNREIVKSFQEYVKENHSILIGKKIFLVDGGLSKVMTEFFAKWRETVELTDWNSLYFCRSSYGTSTQLHISLTVWGGNSREKSANGVNTTYNTNVENTIWDIIKINKESVFEDYDMSERFSTEYTYNAYEGAKIMIDGYKEQIKILENLISKYNDLIPPQLRSK